MPLPGGASDKYGNRYEGKWTAYCVAQVMTEEADSIHLEPVGEDGEGCEFKLQKGSVIEYHQVKRQHALAGDWSIGELSRKGVLRHAFEKTKDANALFVFVSTISTSLLSGLVDDASRSESLSDFTEKFVKGDKVKAWKDLLADWYAHVQEEIGSDRVSPTEEPRSVHERIAYERLKRIHIRTLDEDTLTEMVDTKLRTLVRTRPATVRCGLCAFVLESIHNTLYADAFWSFVEKQGHSRVDYAKDTTVLAAVDELNKRYEAMIKGIGQGIKVQRKEVSVVMGGLKGCGRKTSALVSGEAGVGKTCVLGLVIDQLRNEGVPHLYFRVDRLEPTELPQNVGEQLGLPSTPAEVLAGVARGRPCVLIVDQLDAVSFVSGRNPEFFHCVHEVILQGRAFPNMRLLLACRRFDIEKDNRLRELVAERGLAEEVNVKPFTADEVKGVLQELGCRASEYTERQIELLRLPLHLSILAELLQQPREKALVFATSVDLFSDYWDMKHRAVRIRTGQAHDDWISVLDCLCDKMTARQTLFVPEHEVIDDYDHTVRAMESEGVLVLDQGRVGFFHEGLFDYVVARRFWAKGRDLVQYLKEGEQGLFKRAPMRQILLHAHTSDHATFVNELRTVVLDPTIRFHLRQCAMEVASKVDYASPELWQLFNDCVAGADPAISREVWRVICGSPAWFPFLHGKGFIAMWLASDDPMERQHALAIVRHRICTCPEECSGLLSPYVGTSENWDAVILHIIWHDALCIHRCVFDLFMRILGTGTFVKESQHDFWTCIYNLPKRHPEWAAEALGQHLRLVIENTNLKEVKWHFIPNGGRCKQEIHEIAESVPTSFLEAVLPSLLEVVKGSACELEGRLTIDRVWYARSYREEALYVEDGILLGIEEAFKKLADTSIPDFDRFLDGLFPYGNYDSVNFVVVRALAVAPVEFANRSVDYILANPQRLESGWVSARSGDFSYWAARELVAHIAGTCSDVSFERLENVLTTHFPAWELKKDGQRWRGVWQFLMLTAVPAVRLTPKGKARLEEWQRKFPGRKIEPPVVSKVEFVGSPIEESAISKMNDDQWLHALETYDTDDSCRRRPGGFLEGGAHQLSGVLESETKRDPVRFANLSKRFPAGTHRYYYDAVLRGLKESSADKDMVFAAVRRIHALPTRPGHRNLCDTIAKFSAEHIPDDILAIVGWCATEANDPPRDELKVHTHGDKDHYAHDLHSTAINSVRGAAADTMGRLLFADGTRLSFFSSYLEKLVRDPTAVVRCTAAHALLALYNKDESRAVDLFLILTDCAVDALLETHYVESFLYYSNIRHFSKMRPILRRMLDSDRDGVRESGARLACLAQFANADAKDLVDECVSGDDAKRKGAAKVAACNLFKSECIAFAHATLPLFFDDEVKEVRDEAAACFREAEGRDFESAGPVILAFLKSRAFNENMDDLFWPLKSSTADVPEEILLACETVVAHAEATPFDAANRFFFQMGSVAELVLRAYRISDDDAVRNRCLDIVDRLIAVEVHGIDEELKKFER